MGWSFVCQGPSPLSNATRTRFRVDVQVAYLPTNLPTYLPTYLTKKKRHLTFCGARHHDVQGKQGPAGEAGEAGASGVAIRFNSHQTGLVNATGTGTYPGAA